MATAERTYGQWCPIAVGLDLIGDRWVLLICRELMLGDQRFTDLRTALPGVAPSLLTDRLRSLEAAGMVTTVELAPPAARTVYRLTEHGRSVGPVLRSLARFGVQHLDGEPAATMDARRIANALLVPWRQRVEESLRIRLVLGRTANDATDVVLDGLTTRFESVTGDADVTIRTSVSALLDARHDPKAKLSASYAGPATKVRAALAAFSLRR